MKRLFFAVVILTLAVNSQASPSFREVKDSYRKSDTVLLDRHGKVLHELRTDAKGRRLDWVRLKDVSPALRNAIIFSEDRRFYSHSGVDWKAALTAGIKNLYSQTSRGASTITMQLAALLNKELRPRNNKKTLAQKWAQMEAARDIEKTWSKDEIFEAYLNLITYRGELQGVSAASRGLFNKEPSGLDDAESFILASLIRSPNALADDVSKRACVLSGAIGSAAKCEEMRDLVQKSMGVPYMIKPGMALAPHIARRLLKGQSGPVVSTLDREMQKFASDVLRLQISSVRAQNVKDGAVLVVENKTGDILAYVGSSGAESTASYVDGVQAKRQAGSTLKPLLYASAFEKKILTPASIMNDSPTDIPTVGGIYKPENYENDYKGMVSARTALASSLNIPAVKVLSMLGVDTFVQKLKELGFDLPGYGYFYGPSLALGSADVSLYELVDAFRTLANNGVHGKMRLTFAEERGRRSRIFSEEAAFLVTNILSDREARGVTFSLENPLSTRYWSAVKTGTSKDMRDNWCIGYSQKYTVGVWVGNFGGEPMWNVSGVTGAAPAWLDIMNYLQKDKASLSPNIPRGVVARKIGFGDKVEPERFEWFMQGTEPAASGQEEAILQEIAHSASAKILYPVKGAILAVDPDIPDDMQMVFFEARAGSLPVRWMLDGREIGDASGEVQWKPRAGNHRLSLMDAGNNVIDSVNFQVRGN